MTTKKKATKVKKMSTKDPKALARIDADILRAVSVLAKALNIPQYQALEDAALAWIEAHKGACALRLPDTPPPKTATA